MNLYSNKQKWKIALMMIAIVMVGASLFVSNNIVSKVGSRERERALHIVQELSRDRTKEGALELSRPRQQLGGRVLSRGGGTSKRHLLREEPKHGL